MAGGLNGSVIPGGLFPGLGSAGTAGSGGLNFSAPQMPVQRPMQMPTTDAGYTPSELAFLQNPFAPEIQSQQPISWAQNLYPQQQAPQQQAPQGFVPRLLQILGRANQFGGGV